MSNAATAFRRSRVRTIGLLIAMAPALLLAACQSRDEEMNAKVAAAEAAATRAVAAQKAAEAAAAAARAGQPAAQSFADDPEPEPAAHNEGETTANSDGVVEEPVPG
ncbi:MAG: hypothetical protein IT550_07430 [Novosphingobium sp.]|nr:hypothetical protein [Novosphingobium sp.]